MYVIEAEWTNGEKYGFVSGTGENVTDSTEARKFSLPADAECWIESNPHWVDSWLKKLVSLRVVKLSVVEEPILA